MLPLPVSKTMEKLWGGEPICSVPKYAVLCTTPLLWYASEPKRMLTLDLLTLCRNSAIDAVRLTVTAWAPLTSSTASVVATRLRRRRRLSIIATVTGWEDTEGGTRG